MRWWWTSVFFRHVEYRAEMLRHLVEVTLRHYDPELRSQAAVAVGDVVRLSGPEVLEALVDSQVGRRLVVCHRCDC